MTWRQRTLLIGGVAGAAGAGLTVGASAWLGALPGGGLGAGAAAALGGFAALAATVLLEAEVRDEVAALGALVDGGGGPLAAAMQGELPEVVAALRESLDQARRSEADSAEIGRTARALWSAVHGPPGPDNPMPDPRACVAGLFDLFRQTAESLRRYAASLEEANERMASGALDQSDTVSRTAVTVESLSDRIDRISQNAENATEACERARQEARRGLEQVHQVIDGMDHLRAQIEVNGRKAKRLGDRSVEIGTIVELIRGISSRTDMLALNATIESVRAGEHGRGFAVVAEEIRKLAERTATATRDIGTLVEAIQADTHESIRALSEEQSEVEQEAHRVREAGAALERISQVAEHSANMVDGISRSSHEQVVAAQELVRAMQRITDVSQLTLERTSQSRESIRGLAQWCERFAPLLSAEPKTLNTDDPTPASAASRRTNLRRRVAPSARTP